MFNKIQPIRGTKDLLLQEFNIHEYIIREAQKLSELYNYLPINPPIMEYTEIFNKTLGISSDVLCKEMYSFLDKSNTSISLRPEFTAGVVRSIISNNLYHKLPLKIFSYGPVFRYDRPQAARQRQFHQINFEHVGVNHPYFDAEIIKLASEILKTLKVKDSVYLEINSLGCEHSRSVYLEKISNYFNKFKNDLSKDSLNRLEKNPIRILDSKDKKDKELLENAPIISDYYTYDAKKYFEKTLEYLDLFEIKYVINHKVVRGLDYYSHVVFEFFTKQLKDQPSVIGGGRYNRLVKMMGGPDVPAIGFAGGIERLALICSLNIKQSSAIFLLPIGDESLNASIAITNLLRKNDIKTEILVGGKVSKRILLAIKANAKFIVFIGQEEIENNKYKLKDLQNKSEKLVSIEEIIKLAQS